MRTKKHSSYRQRQKKINGQLEKRLITLQRIRFLIVLDRFLADARIGKKTFLILNLHLEFIHVFRFVVILALYSVKKVGWIFTFFPKN